MSKSLKNLWERFLFRDKGVLPTKKLLLLYAFLSTGFIIASFFVAISWPVIFLLNGFFVLFTLVDLVFSPSKDVLKVTRVLPSEMERGITYAVKMVVENPSDQDMFCEWKDGIPQSFDRPFPISGMVEKGSKKLFTYQTTAPVRGDYEIEKLFLRYKSRIGLWQKQMTVEQRRSVKVIPDLTETKQYLENAQRYLIHEGVNIRKQKSGVGEFAKIRSYVVGDDPRKINWRQTAKLQEVMTNEYEPEHGKYITILVDCGRMMGAELKRGNRLEKSLEAVLTVATATLQKGDYVAVLAFSKKVKAYVPPAKGMQHLQTILQSIYNVQVDAAESNYAEVFQYLQLVQKKRSLILLFSDVKTFLYEESALIYLKRVRQRHLFFMIGVEDETLVTRAKSATNNLEATMIKAIAQQQLLIKKREKLKWEKQGLLMMEAREERLATAAVSHYIDTINRGLL
ncbi:DUF58 domain-containing protein [Sutcliffiella horikoshii]|uniref:DUF58 domain-containing protein n=1 Tax=Sutcliffiella horikoshii TaxID=79883 RepID=UPI001F32AC90|nr:DUF58 domain-containing protein [Sutcliffiella horikoshii]MCG1020881.1 DUF58 domain-containing protein [Sutcliffiella horikoshii]